MTELYMDCRTHGKTHIEEIIFNGSFIVFYGECGCKFAFNSFDVRNLTEEEKREKEIKYIDDHKGKMYQDGSREFEGIMLQDGSYI